MAVAMLILLAATPLGELAAWADGVEAGPAEVGARSLLNRDYQTPEMPDQSRAVLGELLRAGVDSFCTDHAPHVRRVWRLMWP